MTEKSVCFDFIGLPYLNREDPHMFMGFGAEFINRGYEVYTKLSDMDHFPDYYISYKRLFNEYSQKFHDKLMDNGVITVYIYPDVHKKAPPQVYREAMNYQYFLTIDETSIPMWKSYLEYSTVEYFPQAVDPVYYSSENEYSINDCMRNWSYIGSFLPSRFALNEVLETHKYSGKIWGNGWNHCKNNVPWTGYEAYNHMFADIAKKGIVFINCRDTKYRSHRKSWSARLYKGMASGVPVLTDKVAGIDEVFTENKHILLYEDEKELSTILHDPLGQYGRELLQEVAIQAIAEIRKNHTYMKRGVQLCDLLGVR